MTDFAHALTAWQQRHGRHDLPWQGGRDAYVIWVSEIMLQQTQVSAVIPYFRAFMERFPDATRLARAAEDEVMAAWSGLGYYSRARNLHRAARMIVDEYGGRMPQEREPLCALPGIGRSTAAAIRVFAFGARDTILDGNVKRVLARWFGIEGWPGEVAVERRLWSLAESLVPEREVEAYTQGLMDLGATLCTRRQPDCARCPVAGGCRARVEGSTGRIPAARPKRALPQRTTTMLVLRAVDGSVLLERRPPSGIWGGLWSLPECPSEEDPVAWCRTRLGMTAEPTGTRARLRHGFTHFALDILAVELRIVSIAPSVADTAVDGLRVQPSGLAGAPLPAPVRTLLNELLGPGRAQARLAE